MFKKAVQVAFLVFSLAIVLVSAKGLVAVGTAPDADNSELEALKEELEANKEKLEEQNSVTSPTKTESVSSETKEENSGSDEITEENNGNETEGSETGEDVTEENSTETEGTETPQMITAIGDSVMLGASPALLETLPGSYVDAAESRQARKGLEIIKDLESQGKLGNVVVIALGTNGPFKESVGQEIIDYLGSDRTIYWVSVYGSNLQWMGESNSVIEALCNANENVHLIDWGSEGPKHPEWFYKDGIHLKPEGQKGYAEFVKSVIGS